MYRVSNATNMVLTALGLNAVHNMSFVLMGSCWLHCPKKSALATVTHVKAATCDFVVAFTAISMADYIPLGVA